MKHFIVGLIVGLIVGAIASFFIGIEMEGIQKFYVRKLFEKNVKKVPYDEESDIYLAKEARESPKLSIIEAHLIDDSGRRMVALRGTDKGMIECTIENTGGDAKNVRISWGPKALRKLPEQLKLGPRPEPIDELGKNSRKNYRIPVRTTGMQQADEFHVNLYPVHDDHLDRQNFKEFTINVSPRLQGE